MLADSGRRRRRGAAVHAGDFAALVSRGVPRGRPLTAPVPCVPARGLRLQVRRAGGGYGARARRRGAAVRRHQPWQAHDLKSDDGAPITATRIRLLLAGGRRCERRTVCSGRPYFMTGVGGAGPRGRGRFGLPHREPRRARPDAAAGRRRVRRLCARRRRALQSRCERGRGRHVRRPCHRHLRGASAGLLGRSLRQARQGGISAIGCAL